MGRMVRWIGIGILGGAGTWYALRPVDSRGRNTWLPGKWAEWIDMRDGWFNGVAFALFAWVAVGGLPWGRSPGRGRWGWRAAVAGAVVAGTTAFLLEAGQWAGAIPGRRVDGTDVLAAVCGGAVGGWAGSRERRGAG